jgi:hypothetical protein
MILAVTFILTCGFIAGLAWSGEQTRKRQQRRPPPSPPRITSAPSQPRPPRGPVTSALRAGRAYGHTAGTHEYDA